MLMHARTALRRVKLGTVPSSVGFQSATSASVSGATSISVNATGAGTSNQACLVLLQVDPVTTSPSSVIPTFDGTAMTLVHINPFSNSTFYLYGRLLGSLAPGAKTVQLTVDQSCGMCMCAAVFNNVDNTSIANAFTNAVVNNSTGTSATIGVFGAGPDMQVGHVSGAPSGITSSDTQFFYEDNWSSGAYDSAGSYAQGGTGTTLTWTQALGAWRTQGVNVSVAQ